MASSEFELIKKYFLNLTDEDSSIQCGIGDDAAIVKIPRDMDVVLSIDTLLQGTHFPSETDPFDIGYKALAVNLSDMAAMGAVPKWVLLSISLPENDEAWLEKFASGFLELAKQQVLRIEQIKQFGSIWIFSSEREPAAETSSQGQQSPEVAEEPRDPAVTKVSREPERFASVESDG